MKNKYKLLTIIVILVIAATGVFYLNNGTITGYLIGEPSGDDEIPETHDEIFVSQHELHFREDGSSYVIPTRYDIGKDAFCLVDCNFYCETQNMTTYKAYSRRFGECMCKCLPE